jgi:hypothetical protein
VSKPVTAKITTEQVQALIADEAGELENELHYGIGAAQWKPDRGQVLLRAAEIARLGRLLPRAFFSRFHQTLLSPSGG